MINYIWPLGLVVLSNTIYQVMAKSTPQDANPFASLTITYAASLVAAIVLYFAIGKGNGLIHDYAKVNWTSIGLGIAIVGLEVGWIFAYRAGWQVSTAFVVQSAFSALALLVVGLLIFKESIPWNKILGVAICLVGLYFINKNN